MTFHDIRFPVDISIASEGGPVRRTQIVNLSSGFEKRNSQWENSKRRFNAGYGVKSLEDIEKIIAFFEARQGRLHSFRWRDPFDWKSCSIAAEPTALDQPVAIGDGTSVQFQLTKTYQSAAQSYKRDVTKPVLSSILIAVDNVVQSIPGDVTVDPISGQLTFVTPPAAGAVITAGFEFDIEVRFDTDELSISLTSLQAGDIPSIPVMEVFG
ncbi:MAG: phage distal tail protein, Rcc01695 family [bacterium]